MSLPENTRPDTDIALPNETLTTVFETLPPSALAEIARVSRRFNAVAERMLYSSVFITDSISESSPIPRKTLQWCESMRRRTHLLDAARKLHIRWQADPRSHSSHHLSSACAPVADILRRLTLLESLELLLGPANFSIPRAESTHPIERMVRGCYFPYLRYCSLGAEWAKGVQPYTSILGSFLAPLTSLRHLNLPDHHSALDVPSDALPSLSSFRGTADTAAFLLPGRPVQFLSLVGQDSDVNRGNLLRMTHTATPLRYLDLSAMSIRLVLLRNLSTHFPTVETLKIKLTLRHTLHYALSGIVSKHTLSLLAPHL